MKKRWVFLACAWLVQLSAAHAGDASYHIGANLDLHSFHYKEFDAQGNLLDREDGLLPGLGIGAELHFAPYAVVLFAEYQEGVVDYDGQTQTGVPLRTKSDTVITNYSATLTRDVSLFNSHSVTLMAELGERKWDRAIRRTATTNSLYEIYRWPYYRLGGATMLWRRDQLDIGVQVLAGRSFESTLEVHISGYEITTLDLKPGSSYLISIPLVYRWQSDRILTVEPYFHYWHFDKSSSKALISGGTVKGQVFEPENETSSFGITLSMQL